MSLYVNVSVKLCISGQKEDKRKKVGPQNLWVGPSKHNRKDYNLIYWAGLWFGENVVPGRFKIIWNAIASYCEIWNLKTREVYTLHSDTYCSFWYLLCVTDKVSKGYLHGLCGIWSVTPLTFDEASYQFYLTGNLIK